MHDLRGKILEAFLIALEERRQLTRSQVRQAKLEKKGRRLAKRGGKVKGITVSKEAMKHLTDRKPGQGSTPMKPADVVRQLKIAGPKHNKGQIAADAEHGRTTGTALVRKRSEIPDKDVVKTSTVMKKDAGQDVPVTNVQTNKPESAYKTTKGFSAAGPKDPRFMKNVPKRGRARKKFLSGKTLYTAAPGESAPRVGDWKKSGHVTITPKKESIHTARRALAERILGEMHGGMVSTIKDPIKRDDAEFEAGRMNRKAKRSLNKKRISRRATAQAQKTIQGTDPDEPTLSGGSRPWNNEP